MPHCLKFFTMTPPGGDCPIRRREMFVHCCPPISTSSVLLIKYIYGDNNSSQFYLSIVYSTKLFWTTFKINMAVFFLTKNYRTYERSRVFSTYYFTLISFSLIPPRICKSVLSWKTSFKEFFRYLQKK